MGACLHEEFPQPPNGEHPVIAIVAVIAMIVAMLLITWARFAVHGTGDLEAAFTEDAPVEVRSAQERELDDAVISNRFAAGVSPQ